MIFSQEVKLPQRQEEKGEKRPPLYMSPVWQIGSHKLNLQGQPHLLKYLNVTLSCPVVWTLLNSVTLRHSFLQFHCLLGFFSYAANTLRVYYSQKPPRDGSTAFNILCAQSALSGVGNTSQLFIPGACFHQSVNSSFFTEDLLKLVALLLMEIVFSHCKFA